MKRTISIIIATVMLLFLVACGKSADPWQEQYDLGVRYLSDGNYEEAIIAFTAAIEIDPKREEAYVGLADVYYATGDTAKAEEILSQMPERGSEDSVVSRTERVDNDDGSYWVHEYDTSGNLVRLTYYNVDGTVYYYMVYEYDASGNEVRRTYYNADGTVDDYFIFEYDSFGKLRCKTQYSADGAIAYIHNYDSSENLVSETCYNVYGNVSYIHEYDAAGRYVREKYYDSDSGDISIINDYRYHDNSLDVVVTVTKYFSPENHISHEYTYTMQEDTGSVVAVGLCWKDDTGVVSFDIVENNNAGETVRRITYSPIDGTVSESNDY